GANDFPIDERWWLPQAILERFPCDGATLQMEQRLEFMQHSAYPAGRVQIFHVMLTGGLEVHEDRRRIAQRIQMMQVEGQSHAPCNRRQVNDAVCGSTHG